MQEKLTSTEMGYLKQVEILQIEKTENEKSKVSQMKQFQLECVKASETKIEDEI